MMFLSSYGLQRRGKEKRKNRWQRVAPSFSAEDGAHTKRVHHLFRNTETACCKKREKKRKKKERKRKKALASRFKKIQWSRFKKEEGVKGCLLRSIA